MRFLFFVLATKGIREPKQIGLHGRWSRICTTKNTFFSWTPVMAISNNMGVTNFGRMMSFLVSLKLALQFEIMNERNWKHFPLLMCTSPPHRPPHPPVGLEEETPYHSCLTSKSFVFSVANLFKKKFKLYGRKEGNKKRGKKEWRFHIFKKKRF